LRQSPTDDLAIADLKYRKQIIADEIEHNRRLVARFSKLGIQLGDRPRPRASCGGYRNSASGCGPR
jgi:hypothetical protein